jgi:aminoglycoside phosphotransferase (APT) family kinase protein
MPGPRRLVHWDIRNDNLLVRDDGSVVFVDWGACGVGPRWVDPLLARLERVEEPWFDGSIAGSAALADAGDDLVTGWLLGFGCHLAWRTTNAVDVGLPTLNDFRRTESRRVLAGAERRLGS